MINQLKDFYQNQVIKEICEKYCYENIHKIPRLEKIVLNRGMGNIASNAAVVESSIDSFSKIAAQRALITRSRKSVAGFKIRRGVPIGIIVTLRSIRIYTFFDRFVNLAIPCIKDFYGIKVQHASPDGNYNFGLKNQLIFPEICETKTHYSDGINVSIVTSSRVKQERLFVLQAIGIPFINII